MYYFIVNTKSRTGKAADIWKTLEAVLKERNVDYQAFITKSAGHAKELAAEISKLPIENITLVVVGGDGTMNEVINGVKDFSKIRFGYIPLGSGNDLARGLGVCREPLEALEKVLGKGSLKQMDLGCVKYGSGKKKYFAISAGMGIDAFVCKEAEHSILKKILNAVGLGNMTYVCLTIKSLFTMPVVRAEISFDDENIRKLDQVIFIAAMNQRAEGGGVPMAPRATAFDQKLSVCLVHGIPRWKTFFLLPILVLGKHENVRGFEIIDCKKCQITLAKKTVLHTDGEYCGMYHDVEVQCIDKKMNILL
ncbi:MAG: diacylglycerol kinase family lipid kinase [Lachnospiraceae bacterium]|nr:diacylglycerol kinase family lipid kinase [Lachnospiraceae bacterium]